MGRVVSEASEQVKFGEACDGFINFDSVDARVEHDGRVILLFIKGASRNFAFRANTEEEAQAWYYEIGKHI